MVPCLTPVRWTMRSVKQATTSCGNADVQISQSWGLRPNRASRTQPPPHRPQTPPGSTAPISAGWSQASSSAGLYPLSSLHKGVPHIRHIVHNPSGTAGELTGSLRLPGHGSDGTAARPHSGNYTVFHSRHTFIGALPGYAALPVRRGCIRRQNSDIPLGQVQCLPVQSDRSGPTLRR